VGRGAPGLAWRRVVTVASGPLGAAAVHAVRAAQQQVRTPRQVRVRMVAFRQLAWLTRCTGRGNGWAFAVRSSAGSLLSSLM
jgi:hypothetical protein